MALTYVIGDLPDINMEAIDLSDCGEGLVVHTDGRDFIAGYIHEEGVAIYGPARSELQSAVDDLFHSEGYQSRQDLVKRVLSKKRNEFLNRREQIANCWFEETTKYLM